MDAKSTPELEMLAYGQWPSRYSGPAYSRPVEVEFDQDLADAGVVTPFAAKCPACMVKSNAWDINEARMYADMHNFSAHGIPMPPVVRCD